MTSTAPGRPTCIKTLWQALCDDFGCYVLVVDGEGQLHFLNEAGAHWLGITSAAAGGCSLAGVLPYQVANERVEHVRRVLRTGQPLVVDGIIRGEGLRAVLRPLQEEQPPALRVLMVSRPLASLGADSGQHLPGELIQARENDLGPLTHLTPREIDVLTLIASGLTTTEIARRLNRSVKTVQWHRASLGNKLRVKNRVELTLIALRAGFVLREGTMSGQD